MNSAPLILVDKLYYGMSFFLLLEQDLITLKELKISGNAVTMEFSLSKTNNCNTDDQIKVEYVDLRSKYVKYTIQTQSLKVHLPGLSFNTTYYYTVSLIMGNNTVNGHCLNGTFETSKSIT